MYIIIGADGREYGPVTADQVRQWILEGRANAQTKVRTEAAPEWKLLAEFPEFEPAPFAPAPFSVSPVPRVNSMAVTGLVFGILSVTASCCCYGLPFNLVGVILSGIALSQINQDPINQRGKGMAIAGLVLSVLSIIAAALMAMLGFASKWDLFHRVRL